MADGYSLALQRALVTRLKSQLSGLVGTRVYDEPPKKVTFPYVRIGAIEPRPLRTDGKAAASVTFGVEAYSRPRSGRVECRRIIEAIVQALDEQPLTVTGFTAVQVQWLTATVDRDDDGETYEGVAAFSAILDG